MTTGFSNKRWKTPDVAWFDMESLEEGALFFMNMALADSKLEDGLEEEGVKCVAAEGENELWFTREEERRLLACASDRRRVNCVSDQEGISLGRRGQED
jgi:hypothetical protein